jgi:phage terminase large subunit
MIQIAEIFEPLFEDHPFKVSDGGRGGGRSWAFARALLLIGAQQTERILCAREFQSSMKDSVIKLLEDQIEMMGLQGFYTVQRDSIRGINGTEFLFKGLHHNITEIKSTEGITKCWCEESEKISEESWGQLIPTIFRRSNSELWITFNPFKESDPTYQRFIVNPPPGTVRMRAGYNENPWFPDGLKLQLEHDRATNPDRYRWIWEGECLGISDAQIYKGKFIVEDFTANDGEKLLFGADWGFARDPTALIRGFIKDKKLFIEYEAYGVGVEINETPQLFASVPDSNKWPIWADCARPETISYMQKHGYANVKKVDKWPGSPEDGIAYVKSFDKIVVHPRCKHTIEELELYQYKKDRQTGEILPIIVDKNNHCMDGVRYMLNAYIRKKIFVFM